MAKIGRPGLSREQKTELWARWKSGQCSSDIARALERTKGAIHRVLSVKGGIAPAVRRRGPVRAHSCRAEMASVAARLAQRKLNGRT